MGCGDGGEVEEEVTNWRSKLGVERRPRCCGKERIEEDGTNSTHPTHGEARWATTQVSRIKDDVDAGECRKIN
jgi:hypothetical protein